MSESAANKRASSNIKAFLGIALVVSLVLICQLVAGPRAQIVFVLVLWPLVLLLVFIESLPRLTHKDEEVLASLRRRIFRGIVVGAIVIAYSILVLPSMFEFLTDHLDQMRQQADQRQTTK